jgi:hypothetical protein
MALGNVNAAPVRLNALFIHNARLSIPTLQERVILHYREQFVAQIYRVLGSADFLGNPVGLFNNVSSGVQDIFYEPIQGVVMHGHRDLGIGIARVRLLCLVLRRIELIRCRDTGRFKLCKEDRVWYKRQSNQGHRKCWQRPGSCYLRF